MKKIILLESIGIHSKLPDDLNELISGTQAKSLENQISKKPIRFINSRGKLSIQIGQKTVFNASIQIDNSKRRFVLVIDDE